MRTVLCLARVRERSFMRFNVCNGRAVVRYIVRGRFPHFPMYFISGVSCSWAICRKASSTSLKIHLIPLHRGRRN